MWKQKKSPFLYGDFGDQAAAVLVTCTPRPDLVTVLVQDEKETGTSIKIIFGELNGQIYSQGVKTK
jgi:hypothetical protein